MSASALAADLEAPAGGEGDALEPEQRGVRVTRVDGREEPAAPGLVGVLHEEVVPAGSVDNPVPSVHRNPDGPRLVHREVHRESGGNERRPATHSSAGGGSKTGSRTVSDLETMVPAYLNAVAPRSQTQ